jgi:hypothetical protein
MAIHESIITDALVAFAEMVKANYQATWELQDKVTALQLALGKDSLVTPQLEAIRKVRAADPERLALLQRVEDIILKIRKNRCR